MKKTGLLFFVIIFASAAHAFTQVSDTIMLEKRVTALENRLAELSSATVSANALADRATAVSMFHEVFDKNPDFFPPYLTRNLEFHGYFRSGAGINSRGGRMETFKAPTAPAKYRLGNENDTYIEAIFIQNNWNPDPKGVVFKSQLRFAYATAQSTSWDVANQLAIREAFVQIANLIDSDPGMKVWAGERFYRLPELDINDFWWADMSGYGGGLENKNIGVGLLDVSYIADSGSNPIVTQNGKTTKHNIIAELTDVAVPGGKLSAWLNGSYVNGGTQTSGTNTSYSSLGGINAGLMHYYKDADSSNQFGLQYGYGAGYSLTAGADFPLSGAAGRAWRVRANNMYNRKVSDDFSLQAVGVYQYTYSGGGVRDDGTYSYGKNHWASFGVRPIYMFAKHFGIELEPGIDYVQDDYSRLNSYLFKGTAALRVASGKEFFSRPEVRLFATYAQWGKNFTGYPGVGGDAFNNSTSGMTFGLQCETWW